MHIKKISLYYWIIRSETKHMLIMMTRTAATIFMKFMACGQELRL